MGGVKGTKYPLKTRNHAPRTTRHAPRTTHHAPRATHHAPRTTPHGKPKTVSLHFSSKRRGTIKSSTLSSLYWARYLRSCSCHLVSVNPFFRFFYQNLIEPLLVVSVGCDLGRDRTQSDSLLIFTPSI